MVRATRTEVPPTLDGRDDDVIWRSTPTVDRFFEAKPSEGADPKLRTEARVAYDEHNLYVFVRAFDTHPDSIVSLLSRRDDQTASDYVSVMLDPYHDRRTGFEFSVNPAGVKTDFAIYNDANNQGDEDEAAAPECRLLRPFLVGHGLSLQQRAARADLRTRGNASSQKSQEAR